MDDSGVWLPILVGVQSVGFLLAVGGGIWLYRTTIAEAERRRDAGMSDYVPEGDAQTIQMLKSADAEELDGGRLLVLQMVAESLASRRPTALLTIAGVLTQACWLFQDVAVWMKVVVVLLAAFYLVAAIRIERNARVAAAFLRRHPFSSRA
ncbi:hypothetical protein Kisp01_57350 [Kineosporia sp. NBRC 101677]|uniref:hypothetical protein n=1 Tax=Kineosporia sp. NBRC 101677 TaxID=3032197 RepID=UPI0024A57A52|nr:hypothetical protein [Kineosporia sp. NBRC 101677]GLY18721.1 hypothetical protein Kisp01_57350 [Kineosporia sp. NBRC 101677]